MSILRDWSFKGDDLVCDGLTRGESDEKTDALYPYRQYKKKNVNYATCGVGIRERINIVDNAIIAASKV